MLKRDGIMVITVPARNELWSIYDEVSLHKRRYSKKSLRSLLVEANLRPIELRYIFFSLYFPMMLSRRKSSLPEDPFSIGITVNKFLKHLFRIEKRIESVCRLPIGTSLIAVAMGNLRGAPYVSCFAFTLYKTYLLFSRIFSIRGRLEIKPASCS